MERNRRMALARAVSFRALVPLTSHKEGDRYWYDPVDRSVGSLGWGARGYGLDRFGCGEEGVDIGWCCDALRSGH